MRSGGEMAAVQARNPFRDAEGSKVLVLFVDGDISTEGVRHQSDEQIVPGEREMFIHFPSGMGRSRLVIPSAKNSTGRNMNTVAKLAGMARNNPKPLMLSPSVASEP